MAHHLKQMAITSGTVDVSNAYEDAFTTNTRDVTLQQRTDIDYLIKNKNNFVDGSGVTHDVRNGYAYAGFHEIRFFK